MLEFKSDITDEDFYRYDAGINIDNAISNVEHLEKSYEEECKTNGIEPNEEMKTLVEQFVTEMRNEDLDDAVNTFESILKMAGEVMDSDDLMCVDYTVTEQIYTASFDLEDADVYKETAEKRMSEEMKDKTDITKTDLPEADITDMDIADTDNTDTDNTDAEEISAGIEINMDDVDDDTDGIDSGWGD